MKVASVYNAVNTPLQVDKEVKFGKSRLRCSSYKTVMQSDGLILGITKLEKTDNTAADRLRIGDRSYLVYEDFGADGTDALYCICVDDELSDWVLVMPKYWEISTQSGLRNEHVVSKEQPRKIASIKPDSIQDADKIVGHVKEIVAFAFCCFLIIALGFSTRKLVGKKFTQEIETERSITTEITLGGGTNTYESGATIENDTTLEGQLNQEIAEDSSIAEKERNLSVSQSNAVQNSKDTTENSGTGKSNETAKSGEDKTVNPPVASAKETVLIPAIEEVTNTETLEDSDTGVMTLGVSNITLTDDVNSFSVSNVSDYTIEFKMLKGKEVIKSASLAPGETKSIYLRDEFSKSGKATVKYKYVSSSGDDVYSYTADVRVFVYD